VGSAAPELRRYRYFRNSPIFFADRIETPLMIIQGDLDFVPIQQGEEMFSALHRLGKPVVFVRYWGEGHLNAGPANVADFGIECMPGLMNV
jgi:dipeptidyl aminopeptidase/acylaminoacyl peptidase